MESTDLAKLAFGLWRQQGLGTSLCRGSRVTLRRVRKFFLSGKTAMNPQSIVAWWYKGDHPNNFGDALSPILVEWLSGRKPVRSSEIFNISNKPVHYVIGSILRKAQGRKVTIWGSGFIGADDNLACPPQNVQALAVRGPLTRAILVRHGVECPEVYGDPALLCPLFYHPRVRKMYRLGIVPHYLDKSSPVIQRLLEHPDVHVIDVEAGVFSVIDEINRCDLVASSSLHGLIVADAYGIPSLWVEFSDKVAGGGFKFRDYFASVDRQVSDPLQVTHQTTVVELLAGFREYKIHTHLDQLVNVCPFGRHKRGTKRCHPYRTS